MHHGTDQVPLTLTEFRLLCELAASPGRVSAARRCSSVVWEHGFFGDERIVDVHVRRLRTRWNTTERPPAGGHRPRPGIPVGSAVAKRSGAGPGALRPGLAGDRDRLRRGTLLVSVSSSSPRTCSPAATCSTSARRADPAGVRRRQRAQSGVATGAEVGDVLGALVPSGGRTSSCKRRGPWYSSSIDVGQRDVPDRPARDRPGQRGGGRPVPANGGPVIGVPLAAAGACKRSLRARRRRGPRP